MPRRHTGEEEAELHLFLTTALGKKPLVCINTRLGGPQSQSGHCEEHTSLLHLSEIKPSIFQPVVESKHQLHNTGCCNFYIMIQLNPQQNM